MLRCEIRNGTPRRPKTPVLTANATGATDRPEMGSPKNQCVMSTPGAMKSRRVATKATGGEASATARRGASRATAATLDNRIKASGDLTRRANRYLRCDTWLRERLQLSTPTLKLAVRRWGSGWRRRGVGEPAAG